MKAYKGKVFKITEDYAIVLSEAGEFHSIKARGKMLISSEVLYTDYDMVKVHKKNWNRQTFSRIALVASFLCVMLIGYFSYISTSSTYAMVSLDINPSIDLYLNKKLEITKVYGHNDEGESIASRIDIGMTLDEAVETIVLQAISKGYIKDNNNEILVATALLKKSNGKNVEEINDQVYKTVTKVSTNNIVIYTMKVEHVDLKASIKAGMSIGMYELSVQYYGDVVIEDITSLNDIIKKIQNLNLVKEKVKIIERDYNPNKIPNQMKEKVPMDSGSYDEVGDILTDELTNGIDSTINQSTKTIDNTIDKGTDTVNKAIENGTDSVNKIIENGTDSVNKIIDNGTDIVDKVIDNGSDTINKVIENNNDTVNKIIDDGTDSVNKAIDDGLDTVNKIVEDGLD